jgi:hypothetical protein
VSNTYAYTYKDGSHTWVDVNYDTNFYFIHSLHN